jgi:SAM-dependent methyltransferase
MANEFQLGGIVPWGRNAAEYEAFFQLSGLPHACRVLDCGGGPASFAAEWGARGYFVVSTDPIYRQTPQQIAAGFEPTSRRMLRGMHEARDRFDWSFYGSPEEVVERRRNALRDFLADMPVPSREARYVAAKLPDLPFSAGSFDLVLCSHLLFLYSDEMSRDMHIDSIRELLRVGREVRVFPLFDLHGRESRHLQPVIDHFASYVRCDIVRVDFEFQRGASSMLRLSRTA